MLKAKHTTPAGTWVIADIRNMGGAFSFSEVDFLELQVNNFSLVKWVE